MRVLPSAVGRTENADPVEKLAGRVAPGAGAPSRGARSLSRSGAAFAGERR